ncbi:hypothetical protein [Glycomyces terrestris]|uniref:Zinc ribbon domain-containing protein n=1 Tax=Glycomyces terrestris TaxID=2493553 RepID=A0A426US98_9ACTN|nr:hypothetical protein [Glycomyces terrestris]RRR96404.1 hypothetical protein EIW28_21415 [Glycomyces terrestris]
MLPVCPCVACGEPLPVAAGATVVACGSCGTSLHGRPAARRLVDPDWAALPPKATGRYADDTPEAIVVPDAMVPFRVERATARRLLREAARRRWFAPRAFRRVDESESFRAAYLPHWVWGAWTRSRYRAARGDFYWSRAGRAGARGSRVRGVRWRPAAGSVDLVFADVAIPATVRVEARMLADLMRDWTLGDAVPFDASLLEGCWVQRYDLEPEVGLELAKARMAAGIEREVRSRVGGDAQHVPVIETAFSGLGYRLVLLPVWLASYPHRGGRRMVAVHGETGRVVCGRPWSGPKLGAAFAFAAAVASVILYSVL